MSFRGKRRMSDEKSHYKKEKIPPPSSYGMTIYKKKLKCHFEGSEE